MLSYELLDDRLSQLARTLDYKASGRGFNSARDYEFLVRNYLLSIRARRKYDTELLILVSTPHRVSKEEKHLTKRMRRPRDDGLREGRRRIS